MFPSVSPSRCSASTITRRTAPSGRSGSSRIATKRRRQPRNGTRKGGDVVAVEMEVQISLVLSIEDDDGDALADARLLALLRGALMAGGHQTKDIRRRLYDILSECIKRP